MEPWSFGFFWYCSLFFSQSSSARSNFCSAINDATKLFISIKDTFFLLNPMTLKESLMKTAVNTAAMIEVTISIGTLL
jgi:hypothetical protein